MGKRTRIAGTAPLTTNDTAPHTAATAGAPAVVVGLAAGRGGARRIRLRGSPGRRGTRRQSLSMPRLRPRDTFGNRACRGLAGGCPRIRDRGPTALAHPVLEQPRDSRSDPEVVV